MSAARSRFATVCTVIALLLPGVSFAQSNDNIGARVLRLSVVDGDVLIRQVDGDGFQKAFVNMPVTYGSRIVAREGAAAEVELENGTTIRLTPQSDISFEELTGSDSGNTGTTVAVQQGLVYFDVRPRPDDRFTVKFGQERVALHHRAEFRLAVASDEYEVAVLSGEAVVENNSSLTVQVHSGESLAFDPQDETRYDLSQQVAQDSYDGWDQERRTYRNQYAQPEVSNQTAESDAGQSNENPAQDGNDQVQSTDSTSYAATDLNYYGTYFSYVGYGLLWRPKYLPATWNPYANGAWVFVPGTGYVWVSAYPWGWAPFHYGSWVFVPTRGWCWHPTGHRHHNWAPAVRLVNAPAGVQIPAKPANPESPARIVSVGTGLVPQRGALGFQPGTSRLPARKSAFMSGSNTMQSNDNNNVQQGDQRVSRTGAHVFQNSDFAAQPTDVPVATVPTDVVLVPVQVPVQSGNTNPAQPSTPGHWMTAATSPSSFSAATSPNSFSAATSPGNRSATGGMTAATSVPGGNQVQFVPVVPVAVPVDQGVPDQQPDPSFQSGAAQKPANMNGNNPNAQPYPRFHTLPAVAPMPHQGTNVPQQPAQPQTHGTGVVGATSQHSMGSATGHGSAK